MEMIHSTNYTLYDNRIRKEMLIALLSDLHYSYTVKDKKLNYILNKLIKIAPNYILIIGDLLDTVDMIFDEKERERLVVWIKELAQFTTVLISLGSHDYYRKHNPENPKMFSYYWDNKFFEELNYISNVYVLDNQAYEDKDIYIVGYTQSMECYHPYEKTSTFQHVREDKEKMLLELQNLKKKVGRIPNDKPSILMSHSPINLVEPIIEKELIDLDYYVSGHMHNGCVPPILDELWNSDRGLVAPNKELFPKTERNTLKNKGDKLIVNGPLTTFQECTGPIQIFNAFYPYYMSTMNFTNNPEYDTEQIQVRKRYIK